MAGEGVFGNIVASLGGGFDQERDRQRLEARQAMLDKLAQQKETDTRNKSDFDQSLRAREAGLIPRSEVQGQYTDLNNKTGLDLATARIPIQQTGIGGAPTAMSAATPDDQNLSQLDSSAPAPSILPAVATAPNQSPASMATPAMAGLGKAVDLLSKPGITMPTSHGQQPMIFDYSQSKDARDTVKENAKQDAMTAREIQKEDAAAARAAAAAVTLGPGQNRYDSQGNIIAGGPAAKPILKSYQRKDGSYGSVDESTGLDVETGKRAQGMVPKDPNATKDHWMPAGVDKTTGEPLLLNTLTGETKVGGGIKTPGGGMGGSLDADSRAKMMAQAKIDNDEMKRIEGRVMRGEIQFGTGAGLASAAANAHGGPLNEALSVLGNSAAGMLDPDIQKYLTANSSYGRIMGNLQSKRYTDNQAQIEKTISGLKGNDLNNTIAYKQQLRDASLNDVSPSAGGGGRSQGLGGKTITATEAAHFSPAELKALQAKGYTVTP